MASTSSRSTLEQQAQTRRSRYRDALQARPTEETETHIASLREQMAAARDTVTNSVAAERQRLDILADYELYIQVTRPESTAWTTDKEQLFEQLAGFFQDKLDTVKARAADAQYVKAVTLRHWEVALMTGVIERVEDQDQVRELLRGKRADRKDALPYRLKQFSASLIETYNLD
ncbi:hypothetical protein V8E36_008435 [Tilletia maclaganii]